MKALSPSALAAVAGITSLIATVKSLSGVFNTAIDNYSHFEKMEMGLTTFFQDADKGKAKFEELRKLSNETTFGVDELADSFTQLANVGVNVDSIKGNLTMLGNLASGDKVKFAELTSIYAKIQSTGKAGAMQLQQIASRGIPIYDVLKKIGVQGSATAEDITRAFEQMTEQGGQFYNAMENINSTIEGKEGFISDYFKEMTVNFAEVSGIADAYKEVLDIVREKIGEVSDKLLEWSKNPVATAIFRGVIVASLVAIGTTITTIIIPALIKTIAELQIIATLKAMINPTALLIGAGVAVVAGLATAVANLSDSQEDLASSTDTATQAIQEQYNKLSELDKLEKAREMRKFYLEQIEAQKNGIKELIEQKNKLMGTLKQEEEYENNAKEFWGDDYKNYLVGQTADMTGIKGNSTVDRVKSEIEEVEAEIDKANKTIEGFYKLINGEETTIEKLSPYEKQAKTIKELTTAFEGMYDGIKDDNKELLELNAQMKQLNDFKALEGTEYFDEKGNIAIFTFDDETRRQIDETAKYLQDKIDQVQLKLDLANMPQWQKDLQKALGFDDKTAVSLKGESGDKWLAEYKKIGDEQAKRMEQTNKALGINQKVDTKASLLEQSQALKKLAEDLVKTSSEKFGMQENGELDNTFKALQVELENLKKKFIDANGSVEEWDKAMNNVTEQTSASVSSLSDLTAKLMQIAKDTNNSTSARVGAYAGAKMIGAVQGTAVGAAAEGAMEGMSVAGPWGALIGAILGLLQTMEHWQNFLDELDQIVEPLKPILDAIIHLLIGISDVLEAFAEPIQDLLSWITQLINLFAVLFKGFAKLISGINSAFSFALEPVKAFANVIGDLVGWLADWFGVEKEINDEKQKELDQQMALYDAYAGMLSVLRDTQEEYEKRKKYINAQGYADSVTGVHDMILTPQGRFSTDPDDYIIATKNPKGLNGGKGDIIINNYSNAQVEATQDDLGNTVILISQKVAMDYAQGNNGWDSAIQARQARVAGRNLAM